MHESWIWPRCVRFRPLGLGQSCPLTISSTSACRKTLLENWLHPMKCMLLRIVALKDTEMQLNWITLIRIKCRFTFCGPFSMWLSIRFSWASTNAQIEVDPLLIRFKVNIDHFLIKSVQLKIKKSGVCKPNEFRGAWKAIRIWALLFRHYILVKLSIRMILMGITLNHSLHQFENWCPLQPVSPLATAAALMR